MSIKRRINQLEKIAGQQGELTPEAMAERCRYIEERLFNVKRLASDKPIRLFDSLDARLFDGLDEDENDEY